ncbi:aminotransferase class I/II-fold pyridoxal phosphate-dependent enzyme [SAR86 cluster bacterium]|nr:aminotransferase class I/II-fold pyridoxal phosphate-dependent enzyme [SAR86 cluster bacterium]
MIQDLVCKSDILIRDVFHKIDKNGHGTCFVVDDQNILIGVITDGDLRRSLLNGHDLSSPIKNVINKNYTFATTDDDANKVLSRLSDEIKIIPIVDQSQHVVDFASYNHIPMTPVATPDLYGNELKYLTDAFLSTWISSTGEYINRLENNFAKYCNTDYSTSVCNGTIALELALKSIGVGAGSEVIIPDLTFAATINAVIHVGATPVIVDIEENSWCISPNEIEKAITKKTSAIIPVHIYGQPASMDKICEIGKRYNIPIIEDCAEAHGASFNNVPVGSIGTIGCFSFFANKIMTTGEGGMCTTNSKEILEKMNILKNHGMSKEKKYWHEHPGFNFRLTNTQAAIGVAQLERIDYMLKIRADHEEKYRELFSNVDMNLSFQENIPGRTRVVWLACALTDSSENRERLYEKMQAIKIDVRRFFYPLSDMPPYKQFAKNPCPITKDISSRGISFPTFNNNLRINEITKKIKEYY